MKILFMSFLAAIILLSPIYAQEDTIAADKERMNVSINNDSTSLTISDNEIISVEEKNDTTRIRIGKKVITVIEGSDSDGVKIDIKDLEQSEDTIIEDSDQDGKSEKTTKPKKFKGHWAGIQAGLNNYTNADFSTSLDNTMDFMDLNTGKSWTYNINFMQHSFGFRSNKSGIVTGLGLEWNNYNFDKDFSILKDSLGFIVPNPLVSLENIVKNKLQTVYLTVPLLLEFQIPTSNKRIHFSGGLIGALKLGSHTKIVYKQEGDRRKIKDKDDFNLSPFKYGITTRAGYKGLNLFAIYYLTSFFESKRGPELYPFSIGLTLVNF